MVQLNLDSPKLAQTYDKISDSQFTRGSELVERLNVQKDDVVLDIGSGTGRLGFHVLKTKLGPKGQLFGLDPLPDRIAIAVEKNTFPNGHFQVGLAEDLGDFNDESIDVVYLSSVFHWVNDKPKALREIYRVLKHGGRVGLTTGARELQSQGTSRKVIDYVLSQPPYKGRVNIEDYVTNRNGVTSTQLIELFLDAGFELKQLDVQSHARNHPNGASILDFSESSTFGNYLNHVPEDLRKQARADIEAEFDRQADGQPIKLVGYSLFGIASKP